MSNKEIVVVDDEKDIVKLLKFFLEKGGEEEVKVARKGKEALKIIEEIRRKKEKKEIVVVTDIKMPEMDGFELAKNINNTWKNVKIIFITAYDLPKIEQEALGLGVQKVLLKKIGIKKMTEEIIKIAKE